MFLENRQLVAVVVMGFYHYLKIHLLQVLFVEIFIARSGSRSMRRVNRTPSGRFSQAFTAESGG